MHVLQFRAARKYTWWNACNLWSNADARQFGSELLWDHPACVEVEAWNLQKSRRFASAGPDALEPVAIVQIKRMSRVIARDSRVALGRRAYNLKPQTGWVEIVSASISSEHMAHLCRRLDYE